VGCRGGGWGGVGGGGGGVCCLLSVVVSDPYIVIPSIWMGIVCVLLVCAGFVQLFICYSAVIFWGRPFGLCSATCSGLICGDVVYFLC